MCTAQTVGTHESSSEASGEETNNIQANHTHENINLYENIEQRLLASTS